MPSPTPPTALTLDDAGMPLAGGRPLKLPPQERAVLRLLMQRGPGVVRKDEFAQQAWSGRDMSDEGLARCISRVRRVVEPMGLRVEAVYGTGYRLLVPAPAGAPRPGAQALDAWAHARQLVQQRTPAAMARAIDILRRLVADEPDFAAARVALADALGVAVGWGQLPTPEAVAEGLAALDGIGADGAGEPGLQAARGALLDMAWRFDEAQACFERALAADPDGAETLLAFSRHLLYVDDAARAVALLRRVRGLSPHALHVRMSLARALVQAGDGAAAVQEAQATLADHPGQLVTVAFALALEAMVSPHPELEEAALRLTRGADTPPFVWTVASFVLSRLGQREATLDIVDIALLCSRTTAGEAALYAAPLAAIGELDRAADLLRRAVDERCGMMALVLRDPAHAHWLPQHPAGRMLLQRVYGIA